MKLKGKIALITGASRGIGRGIAEIFAEEGADVAVNYAASAAKAEEVAAWVRSKGRRAITVKADVARRSEVEAMFDKVWKELGPIDILVNNAGIETITPFLELTDEQWTRLVDTNLRGCWLNSQVFCKRAIAEGRKGNIIHIGSVQSAKSLPGRTHYAPTKLGLNALTRNMSTRGRAARHPRQLRPPGPDRDRHDRLGHEGPRDPAAGPRADFARSRRSAARSRHGRRVLRVRRGAVRDRTVAAGRGRLRREVGKGRGQRQEPRRSP